MILPNSTYTNVERFKHTKCTIVRKRERQTTKTTLRRNAYSNNRNRLQQHNCCWQITKMRSIS